MLVLDDFLIATGDHDLRSLSDESSRRGQANTAVAPRNDCNLVFETIHSDFSFFERLK
jgi:hypothetical protein